MENAIDALDADNIIYSHNFDDIDYNNY